MRILVVGSGAREHALAWRLGQSAQVDEVVCAPGNAGIARAFGCIPLDVTDVSSIVEVSVQTDASMVVVGPEVPLVAGAADALRDSGRLVFGPTKSGALIEGSKAFAKRVMQAAGVPTAATEVYEDVDQALAAIDRMGGPAVVKADGLAAGKGVTVCNTVEEGRAAVIEAMRSRRFGEAGARVLIEERMAGPELSILAFSDGRHVTAMPAAQDHKRAYDGDEGPNTGGMGAFSPVPFCTDDMLASAVGDIIHPVVHQLAREGDPYTGVLYAGLMLTSEGLKVIEFNCRFGDPEAQALLPRLDTDLAEILDACITGHLDEVKVGWTTDACVSVVLASSGYPEADPVPAGYEIEGLADAETITGLPVFCAGVAEKDGRLVTSGGRVASISAVAGDLDAARATAYAAADAIEFEGKRFRSDIALATR